MQKRRESDKREWKLGAIIRASMNRIALAGIKTLNIARKRSTVNRFQFRLMKNETSHNVMIVDDWYHDIPLLIKLSLQIIINYI